MPVLSVLTEHQVLHLLEHCEAAIGRQLDGVRGQLRSEWHVRSAIWELILIDAATQLGKVEYERRTPSGKTPDLYVETADGAVWMEAAFLLPRFAHVEARQEAYRRAVWAEERRVGITPGSIACEFYGKRTAYGFDIRLPQLHELPAFFRSDIVRGFFDSVGQNPQQSADVDFGEYGAAVRLAYITGRPAHGGSSVVIEQPRDVEEHAVYRILKKKAKKYRTADLAAPLIVCIGSERSTAVRQMGPLTVSTDQAMREACCEHPVISGVIVVSIEDRIPVLGSMDRGRRAVVRATANESASYPLSDALLRRLNLDFNRIEYGDSWNEWEGVTSAGDRLARLGGSLLYQGKKDGSFDITLAAHEIVRVLGGGWTAAELQANYRFTDAENPFRRAMEEGRPIIGVELLPHNPRSREPQQIRISFGPPRPMLLQKAPK